MAGRLRAACASDRPTSFRCGERHEKARYDRRILVLAEVNLQNDMDKTEIVLNVQWYHEMAYSWQKATHNHTFYIGGLHWRGAHNSQNMPFLAMLRMRFKFEESN